MEYFKLDLKIITSHISGENAKYTFRITDTFTSRFFSHLSIVVNGYSR